MFHPRYLGRVPYLSTRVCASRLIISLGIANIYITDFSNTAYLNPGMFVGKHMPSLVAGIFEAFCDYAQDIIYQRSPGMFVGKHMPSLVALRCEAFNSSTRDRGETRFQWLVGYPRIT